MIFILKYIYWLYLKFDLKTCAELPHVKEMKRRKIDKYNPF